MRRFFLPLFSIVVLAVGVLVAGQQSAPGTGSGAAGAGQIRARPGAGREPEFPAPKITEYKPKSTLVVPEHPTPRAKYPVVDIHSHHQRVFASDAEFETVVKGMDANNLRVLVNLSGGSGDRITQWIDFLKKTKHQNRLVVFANVAFPRGGEPGVGPGFGAKAAAQLEADIGKGAMGLKIFKDLGMFTRKADGSRLPLDDPELSPIWEVCGRLNVPVLIHTAEPLAFFEPLDYSNERWLELALFRDRRHQEGVRFEELMAERDRMFARHPKTRFILAHFGWHANDLGRVSRMLDAMPNVYPEVAAILYELGRQPRTANAFFVKYQDRVLFGKDSYQPDEYPYYWRTFETSDEYFDYYRDYHAFWKLYGMNLPDEVLKKLYYKNALKLLAGLPDSGFPR